MAGPWEEFPQAAPAVEAEAKGPWDTFAGAEAAPQEKVGSGFLRQIADAPVGLVKGVLDLPNVALGLADIATAGGASNLVDKAGDVADRVGIPEVARPTQWANQMDSLYSPEMQASKAAAHQSAIDSAAAAKESGDGTLGQEVAGFGGYLKGVAENPRSALALITENYGGMKAIAKGTEKLLARALPEINAAVKSGTMTAAEADAKIADLASRHSAIGEGVLTAGQGAQQVRQANPDATAGDYLSQVPAGIITGGIARGVGKIPGLEDAEAAMALNALGREGKLSGGLASRVGKGVLSEGVLQELPQGVQENAWQNYAEGKPIFEGAGEQAAQGILAGGALGGGVAGLSHFARKPTEGALVESLPVPPPSPALLGYDPSVPDNPTIIMPNPGGGSTAIDPRTGPLSSAAVASVKSGATAEMVKGNSLLMPFATREAAQQVLGDRADAERNTIVPHPRVDGRFAIVPKSQTELAGIDARQRSQQEAQTRAEQLASEEEGSKQDLAAMKSATELHKHAAALEKSITDHTAPEDVAAIKEQAAALRLRAREVQDKSNAAIADRAKGKLASDLQSPEARDAAQQAVDNDAAQTELAVPAPQPVAAMPAAAGVVKERTSAAQSEAQARLDQLASEEDQSIDSAAQVANPKPTEAQQKAGNYSKGHIRVSGLDIAIENPAGTKRSGIENGKKWATKMSAHYGYIKRTEGADGDQVDVYVKAGTAAGHSGPIFVADQYNPGTGEFDEHKALIGYDNQAQASKAYDAHFSDKSGPKRRGAITAMTPEGFKSWLKSGDTKAPVSSTKFGGVTASPEDAAQEEIANSTGENTTPKQGANNGTSPAQAVETKEERPEQQPAAEDQPPVEPELPAAVAEASAPAPATESNSAATPAPEAADEKPVEPTAPKEKAQVIAKQPAEPKPEIKQAPEKGVALESRARQTDTPEFKKWFGDSKVVDADGEPLVVYHSTNALPWGTNDLGFSKFLTDTSELGAHFGSKEQANMFGAAENRRIMPAYLSIENPLRLEDRGSFFEEDVARQLVDLGIIPNDGRGFERKPTINRLHEAINDHGYDGVVYLNRRESNDVFGPDGVDGDTLDQMSDEDVLSQFPDLHDSWIAFRPEQIKSAIGNNGKFDSSNPDIRESISASGPVAGAAPVRAIQSVVDKFKTQFKGASALNIRVVNSVDDIPAQFRPSPYAEGVYHDDAGLIYLIAKTLSNANGSANANRAVQVLLHEAVGHYGLANMMGDRFKGVQRAVMQLARDPSVTRDIYEPGDKQYATVEAVRLRYPDASESDVAQEVLARMAETGSTKFQMVRAMIRQWFRDMARAMGFDLKISDSELNDLVAKASAHLRAGKNLEGEFEPSGLVAASRKAELPARDRENIDTAMRRMDKFVAEFESGRMKDTDTQILGPTPTVLQALGAKDLPLHINGGALRHILVDRHSHLITAGMMKQIPEAIYDPLMVFDSTNPGEAKVILTELQSTQGTPVVAIVHLNKKDGYVSVNRIASVYEKTDGGNSIGNWIDARLLRYVRNDKSLAGADLKHLLPLEVIRKAALAARDSRTNILTEDDIVNSHGPMYSLARSTLGDLTSDQLDAVNRVLGTPKTFAQKLSAFKQDWKKNLVQGIFDQFAPIMELDQNAYIQARLAKGGDSTLEALMLYGKLKLDKSGATDVEYTRAGGQNGFAQAMSKLKGEHERFLLWVAAQRADRLKSIGLENLWSQADINTLKRLNAGAMKDGSNRAPLYQKALSDLNDFNDNVLEIAEKSGLIDPATRKMYKDQPYIPFYRLQDDKVPGFAIKPGIVNQSAWKKMKGGTEKLNEDLMANLLQNWSHLITASAKNRAAKATLDAAVKAKVADQVPNGAPGKGHVSYKEGGVDKTFIVMDPHLMDAVAALDYVSLGPWAKPLVTAKHWLTVGVTANPAFKLRNLIRDSIQSIGTASLSYNPAKNIGQGWGSTSKEAETRAHMLAAGGMIRFGSMLDGQTSQRTKDLIDSGVDPDMILDSDNKITKFWKRYMHPALEAYNELGDRTEQVNRAALYDQLIAKGMTHQEASYWARDLMDFSLSGKWTAIRGLTQVVPFMNARLQGLYKLGRAGSDDYKRMGLTVGAVALFSLATLLIAKRDPDDWKDWQSRTDDDRNNYWWFKVGGHAFRLPKPFEIGAIGTIAERGFEIATDNEMTPKRFGRVVTDLVLNQLSMNPTPQLFKPMMDIYANKDSFSGRDIESVSQQKLRKKDRFDDKTSEVARFLGGLGLPDPTQLVMGRVESLSPKQIDHLARGYFSWLGTMTTTALDYGIRPMMDRGAKPDRTLKDVFLAGNFVETLPANNSRYLGQLYDQAREVEQAYNSYRDRLKIGDTAGAKDILADEKGKIVQYHRLEMLKRQESLMNIQIKRIEASQTMTSEEKRMRLDQVYQRRNKMAELIRQP